MAKLKPKIKFKVRMDLTFKEAELINFTRNEMPFGKCELIIHTGEPQKIIYEKEPSQVIKVFGG